MKMISISGIDKSGKTTVLNALNEVTNYQHFVIERDPATVMFFAQLLGRPIDMKEYDKLMWHYRQMPFLSVLLTCESCILEDRFAEHNEPPLPGGLSIHDHQSGIIEAFLKAQWRFPLVISTSYWNVRETVELILEKLEEI
jgi:hypothetical protein